MSNIKISVIIPVYNIEKYLPKCLNSILDQTLKDIEIICVNDGSVDNSLMILREYANKHENIVIINKENAGPGAARNSGIAVAKGEYIGFVDGDDFIEPEMYEALYKKAVKYDADVAITNAYLYYPKTNEKAIFRDYRLFSNLDEIGSFTAHDYPEILTIVGMWDRIFKKEFVDKIGFKNPEGRFYEDHLPSFESSVLARSIVVVNEPYYYYRQQREGSTVNREAKFDFYKFDFLKDYIDVHRFLKSTNEYDVYQEQFLRYKMPFVVMHQNNMVSFSNFKLFFNEIRKELDNSDYDVLERINYLDWDLMKLYVNCLKHNYIWICIFVFYLKRIIYKDQFYVYIRIPKTKKTFRIKRTHFYQRQQMEVFRVEMMAIRNENAANFKSLELLMQKLVEKNNERDGQDK